MENSQTKKIEQKNSTSQVHVCKKNYLLVLFSTAVVVLSALVFIQFLNEFLSLEVLVGVRAGLVMDLILKLVKKFSCVYCKKLDLEIKF